MKHVFPKRSGFTLIELLTVIGIITILAGLTMSTFSYANNKAARNRATAEIAALSVALESYKVDNGDYPRSTDTDALNANAAASGTSTLINTTTASPAAHVKEASIVLYQQLSGDTNLDGVGGDTVSGQKNPVYFNFKPNMLYPRVPIGTTRSGSTLVQALIDPFRNIYGYSTIGSVSTSGTQAGGYNPTFDLWSAADINQTGSTPQTIWITNW